MALRKQPQSIPEHQDGLSQNAKIERCRPPKRTIQDNQQEHCARTYEKQACRATQHCRHMTRLITTKQPPATSPWHLRTSERLCCGRHTSEGPRKARGKFDCALHARMWKSTICTDEHNRARKKDIVEYSRKMERRWKWTLVQCEAKWDQLKANPLIDTDEKDANSAFKLRSTIVIAKEKIVGHRV